MKPGNRLPASWLWVGQPQHILFLALLVPGAYCLARPALAGGTFLGISETAWFWALIVVVVLHQVLGWFVFRTQLVFGLLTRWFGNRDLTVWGMVFFPFLVLRPLLTIALGWADYASLPRFRGLQIAAGLLLALPAAYAIWSVVRYFGIPRALGGDHFRDKYRHMPLVREGAFRYSPNAMYAFVFLIFWSIGLLAGSRAALAAALFQHAYVWVHWYCTEQPDMQIIYDSGEAG